MITQNKLETISARPGSPRKTIFLSQNLAGKRFEYMELDKGKNSIIEIKGNMLRKSTLDFSNSQKTHSHIRDTEPHNFRSIKLFQQPSSYRTINFALQPEPKNLVQTKSRNTSQQRKVTNESSYMSDSGAIPSLLAKTDTNTHVRRSGRKHNQNMYKSITFESLSNDILGNRSRSSSRTLKKYEFTPKSNKNLLNPALTPRSRLKFEQKSNGGWKNGNWDLSVPYMPEKTPQKKPISGVSTANLTPINKPKPAPSENVNKYVPLSLKKGKDKTVVPAHNNPNIANYQYQNFGHGKSNLAKNLDAGLERKSSKKLR